MNFTRYAAGSIGEAIETRQTPHNIGVQPTRIVTVKATNPYGMVLITEHGSEISAEWQRNQYRLRGYTEIN